MQSNEFNLSEFNSKFPSHQNLYSTDKLTRDECEKKMRETRMKQQFAVAYPDADCTYEELVISDPDMYDVYVYYINPLTKRIYSWNCYSRIWEDDVEYTPLNI